MAPLLSLPRTSTLSCRGGGGLDGGTGGAGFSAFPRGGGGAPVSRSLSLSSLSLSASLTAEPMSMASMSAPSPSSLSEPLPSLDLFDPSARRLPAPPSPLESPLEEELSSMSARITRCSIWLLRCSSVPAMASVNPFTSASDWQPQSVLMQMFPPAAACARWTASSAKRLKSTMNSSITLTTKRWLPLGGRLKCVLSAFTSEKKLTTASLIFTMRFWARSSVSISTSGMPSMESWKLRRICSIVGHRGEPSNVFLSGNETVTALSPMPSASCEVVISWLSSGIAVLPSLPWKRSTSLSAKSNHISRAFSVKGPSTGMSRIHAISLWGWSCRVS
mmetsp:Transcript_8503/g.19313  ORF Transcript_8503/g.19313 Transcript_8503/m.19313 type:complete len:333 (+) Transcript_8503:987-1985(+)